MFHTLNAALDRNGCWLQSSGFVRTACAVLGTSPSFDAQPTSLSSIAHQRNFGSRQTYGEKHRNPARGQRNFWLLFLPLQLVQQSVVDEEATTAPIAEADVKAEAPAAEADAPKAATNADEETPKE